MPGYYRLCNHCSGEMYAPLAWIIHCLAIARNFGHRDDMWAKHATTRERRLIGEEDYAHALRVARLRATDPVP